MGRGMISFEGKVILAPMVRIGTLPMRLLALEYGADLVYTPETVDKKIIGSIRTYNGATGTVDYIKERKTLVFRTHPLEKNRLVFQLGTADPDLALQAALTVSQDVSAVDVNCGCPKRFSLQAGMGAALLRDPDRLLAILRRLVEGVGLPVTAKIRILSCNDDLQPTLDLARRIASTGIKALAVHCRTPAERPRDPAHWQVLSHIAAAIDPVPLIANGDVFTPAHISHLFSFPGVKSVMVARAAQWNPSIFRNGQGLLDLNVVSRRYLQRCIETDNFFGNTKYALLQMWLGNSQETSKHFIHALQTVRSMQEICVLFDMDFSGSVAENVC